MTLSLVVIVVAGLPYLSLQFQKSAVALAASDGVGAIERAGSVRFLQPSDPSPYLTQAGIYARAASAAAASEASDRGGAVLDNLALSVDRFEAAIALEPADWSLRYRAGVTVLNLLLASDYTAGLNPGLDYATLVPEIPGVEDWSELVGSDPTPPAPGLAADSLATNASTQELAAHYRGLYRSELVDLAGDFLEAARERNPLSAQTAEALEMLQQLR